MDLNEFQTRKQKIDVLLKEQGWIVGDGSKVIIDTSMKALWKVRGMIIRELFEEGKINEEQV